MPFSSPSPSPSPQSRLLRELSVGSCARVCGLVVACDAAGGAVTLDDGTARVDALLPRDAPPALEFLRACCPPPAVGQTLDAVSQCVMRPPQGRPQGVRQGDEEATAAEADPSPLPLSPSPPSPQPPLRYVVVAAAFVVSLGVIVLGLLAARRGSFRRCPCRPCRPCGGGARWRLRRQRPTASRTASASHTEMAGRSVVDVVA